MILGHSHPKVIAAVIGRVSGGPVYAAPVEDLLLLAVPVCERVPSADKIGFCNSGTEATLGAIRLATAYKKKHKILKMEGSYHGSHDLAEISIKPPLKNAGFLERPNCVPEVIRVPPGVTDDSIIAPFNGSEITEWVIEENSDEPAAVIVQPVQCSCGMIPPEPGFLNMLRDITSMCKVPLIFDEVISLRLA